MELAWSWYHCQEVWLTHQSLQTQPCCQTRRCPHPTYKETPGGLEGESSAGEQELAAGGSVEGAGVEGLFLFTVWFLFRLLLFFFVLFLIKLTVKQNSPKPSPPRAVSSSHTKHTKQRSPTERNETALSTREGQGQGLRTAVLESEKQLGWGCPGASLTELEKEISRSRS